jgi:hypothetical protein
MDNNFLLNSIMSKAVAKILKNEDHMFLKVEAGITSIYKDGFKLNIRKFISLNIVQDFINNYSDFIEILFELTPTEYIELVEHYKELLCNVRLIKYDPKHVTKLDILAEVSGRFILVDKEDLFKKFPLAAMIETEKGGTFESHRSATVEIKAQIIDPVVYEMRKVRFNDILRDVKMTDVLHYIADKLGVQKTSIVPSDNNKEYANLVIPPMRDVSNIFNYLQNGDGKGVYNKGITHYFTNDVLYVYPPYETNPALSPTVNHIYHVKPNMFEGLESYHILDGDNVHILNNKTADTKDMSEESYENIGTAFILQKSERMLDFWREMKEKRSFNIGIDNVVLLTNHSKKGMTDDIYNAKFNVSNENVFIYRTELLKNELTIMNTEWQHAIPYTFKPGWKLYYHYEGDGTYNVRTGTCVTAVYTIQRTARDDDWIFSSSANLVFYLSNEDPSSTPSPEV